MANSNIILDYYDKLAKDYDNDRFGNSYGHYIHRQETALLVNLLKGLNGNIVDLGCGTGRLSSFATTGLDGSKEMLAVAKAKHPDKNFILAPLQQLPFDDNSVDVFYSFHVFMHLPAETTNAAFAEIARTLKPGGKLIFDFPSAKRRQLFSAGTNGWHGNTAYRIKELKDQLQPAFDLKKYYGILFFPIQRLPGNMRKHCIGLDNLICRSFLKSYASYSVAVLTKK